MASKKTDSKLNPFEKQMEEFKEFQDNAYNPGHYIGTGRTPLSLKNLFKSPVVMLIVGLLCMLPVVLALSHGFSFQNLISEAVPLIIGCAFIYGGVVRILTKKR